jgi:hypothetical protein
MPNPWEPSSFQLKSTLSFAAASLMPPARLSDVMLLPPRSNWQARLHDKFEEFAQGFAKMAKGGDGSVKVGMAGLSMAKQPLAPGAAVKAAPPN